MDFSQFTSRIEWLLPRLPEAALILILGFFGINAFRFFFKNIFRLSKVNEAVVHILNSIATVFLWILVIIFVLKALGFSSLVIALSGSVVIIGVVIATGAKDLMGDILAGIFLSFDKDFNVGDHLKTGKVEGKIESIDIRKVRVRSRQGHLQIVPNSVLERGEFTIIKKKIRKRRVKVSRKK